MPDGFNAARRRMQLTPAYQQTAASELVSWVGDSSRQVDDETQNLGATRLFVMTSELSADIEGADPALQAKLRALHWRYHEELAKISSEATHSLLKNASHFIPAEHPEAVIAVIHAPRKRSKGR
jgi:pimeloyl-ACP methyl ester carboxylesterase